MYLSVSVQAALASTDTSCDSVVTGGLPPQPTPQHSPRASSPAELVSLAQLFCNPQRT
jgi:homeobox-leucine zipper protein